jgi:hypothetical protein
VPPVIAPTLSASSKKGVSTVIDPSFRKVVKTHSHEPLFGLIRTQYP